jgi:hypothetical protein
VGVVGLFNCNVAAGEIGDSFAPAEIPELEGERFAVRLCASERVLVANRDDRIEVKLGQLKSEIAVVSPILNGWIAPLGLLEKYNSPAAITRCELLAEDELVCEVRDGEVVGFWCESEPRLVSTSREARIKFHDHLLRIETETGAALRVIIAR